MADKKKKNDVPCFKPGRSGDCGPGSQPPLVEPPNKPQFRFSMWYFVIFFIGLFILNMLLTMPGGEDLIGFSEFKKKIEDGEIKEVRMGQTYYLGSTAVGESGSERTQGEIYKTVPVDDPGLIALMDEKNVKYYAAPVQQNMIFDIILSWGIPILIMVVIWRFLFKRMGNLGQNVMSFGKNKSQIVAEGSVDTTFGDIAGADEAKGELAEVVDFLKNPKKYLEIGGKIPKGVLLVGPPGCGKTLLARAVAGEAGVIFFRISGADFVEMFVGVGAARVRDLFRQAREKAPCIIFIDELDAIGKSRINTINTNDEREQTLNQLLVEMDGFDAVQGVIILAATNRPEILDPALLRPGRFDRQVVMDRPDLSGREAILKIHSKKVKLDETVDLKDIARATPGFVGADLANIINEAALLAVRGGRKKVSQKDLEEAIEKTVAGLQLKNRIINPKEREIVAYHETGHALVATLTKGADPVHKISIVPRGMGALGYTLQLPVEDRFLMTEDELIGKIDVLLGGRAAEQLVFKKISTGAANDLTKATDIVRKMITDYGMSEKFRNVVFQSRHVPFLGDSAGIGSAREYSENTQTYIDEEIARIINERFLRVSAMLKEKLETLTAIAKKLLEVETLDAGEFKAMVGVAEIS
ncbi:MAG: ATP-dependent zinc metalloprotease FtsH [Spirochaetales bacterium]|nr:ATP-dependent zinc metalloprotease FtsH [Spirochaetales bacterium]